MPLGNYHLKQQSEDFAQQLIKTTPGMAHFAGGGPIGTTCGECRHLIEMIDSCSGKNKRSRCDKYREMMAGKVGERVETMTPSCKYFEKRPRRSK